MTTTVRPRGRAERQAQARQQAREGNARLGALLQEAHVAMRAAVEAWRRGAPGFTLERHVEHAITGLGRAKARLVLDTFAADPPGDLCGRGVAQ